MTLASIMVDMKSNKFSEKSILAHLAMRTRAQEEQRKHNTGYRIQFYTIPNYTPELLEEANRLAGMLKEKSFRMKGISRVSIEQSFGSEVADRVYPLCKGKTNQAGTSTFLSKMEEVLVDEIQQKGYTKFQNLFQKMRERYDWKCPTEDRVARYLPGLLAQHGLREVYSNDELKEQFHIEDLGYPRIIIRSNTSVKSDALNLSELDRELEQAG